MFSNNLFYQGLLLIFYFDNDILIQCSLLSRAKNPIDIFTESVKTAAEDIYLDVPGTLERTESANKLGTLAWSRDVATDPEHLTTPTVPEYVLNRNEPLEGSSTLVNVFRYEAQKPSLEPENLYEPLKTFPPVDKINHYEPRRPAEDAVDVNYYIPLSVTTTTNNKMYKTRKINQRTDNIKAVKSFYTLDNIHGLAPIRNLAEREKVENFEYLGTNPVQGNQNIYVPMRKTLPASIKKHQPGANAVKQYTIQGISAPDAINLYKSARMPPNIIDYGTDKSAYYMPSDYSYEILKSSSSPLIDTMLDPQIQNMNPDEASRTYSSSDNIYRYEVERAYSPVKEYPHDLIKLPTHENSALPQDVYRFEPSKTSPSANYVNPYEPIKFSALYFDDPSWKTKKTSQNYDYQLEYRRNMTASTKIVHQYIPLETIEIPTYPHPLEPTNYVITPSKTALISERTKNIYQFTPYLAYRPPESVIKVKNKMHFTPLLTAATRRVNIKYWEPVNTTKSPEDYWKEFIQNEPEGVLGYVNQKQSRPPSQTTLNVYKKEKVNTLVVNGNVYQLLPLETSRAPDEYWNEFIRNEPRRNFGGKNTVPLRTPPEKNKFFQVPLRTTTLRANLDQHQSEDYPYQRTVGIFYQNAYQSSSRQAVSSDQNAPVAKPIIKQDIDWNGPHEYSTPSDDVYIYQKAPTKTSKSMQNAYYHDFLFTPQQIKSIYQAEPSRSSISVNDRPSIAKGDLYQNHAVRTSRLAENFGVTDFHLIPTPSVNIYQNQLLENFYPAENVYQTDMSSSVNYFYPLESVRTTKLPAFVLHSGSSETISEAVVQTKIRQGFRTLWQPTVATSANNLLITQITEQNLKPSRTTRVFNWIFHDEDAAWPKVELILSTTASTTAATKPKKTFATYFPFYLRTLKEENTSSVKQSIATTTKTAVSVNTTKTSTVDEDHELMMKFIARQRNDTKKDNHTRCYSCGLNITDIPYYPACYHIFDTPSIYSIKKQKYRVICKNPTKKVKRQASDFNIPVKRKTYRGGCFKRFVEFGEVYSERGCRTLEPLKGKSFASLRFAYLERSLANVDEGCIMSPHASLTPFSRGISLYARYHVCVCKGRYCNDAEVITPSVVLLLFNIFLRI